MKGLKSWRRNKVDIINPYKTDLQVKENPNKDLYEKCTKCNGVGFVGAGNENKVLIVSCYECDGLGYVRKGEINWD